MASADDNLQRLSGGPDGASGLSTELLIEEARNIASSPHISDHVADVIVVMASRLESAQQKARKGNG